MYWLEIQEARFGFDTKPETLTEIKNVKEKIKTLKTELKQINESDEEDIAPQIKDEGRSEIGLELPYGVVPLGSNFYVNRNSDHRCWRYISGTGAATIFIQASRLAGKSSLIHRLLDQANHHLNKRTVFIDFQEFLGQDPPTLSERDFLIEFCLIIGRALGVSEAIDSYWEAQGKSNTIKCGLYISEYILPKIKEPVILAMDEIDLLLPFSFRDSFFGMLRAWYDKRAADEQFRKLSFLFSSTTERHHLIRNIYQSPFNVANLVVLRDFSKEEIEELNKRHGSPLASSRVDDLTELLGGHPFLTRLALFKLSNREISADRLFSKAISTDGPFEDHLNYYVWRIFNDPETKRIMLNICQQTDDTYDDNRHFHRLKRAGLIKKVGRKAIPRNNLYARYFQDRLT